MKARLIGIGIGLVIFVIAKVFFVDSDEVKAFNDKLVDISTQNGQGFSTVMEYLGQYAEGQAIDVEALKSSRDQLESSVRSNLEKIDSIDIPDDELCRSFHKALREHAANSLAITERIGEQITYISAHNPGTAEDVEKVDGMLNDLLTKNQVLFATVGSAQQQMADKHDLTLQ